jgi:hypothetical protein
MAHDLPVVIGAPGARKAAKAAAGFVSGVAALVPKKLVRLQPEVENLANQAGFVTLLLNGAGPQTSAHSGGAQD